MAELPELLILARQMNLELAGRVLAGVEVTQQKCLNLPADEFARHLVGRRVESVYNRGKWIFLELSEGGHLLLNLGMGADILHYDTDLPCDTRAQARFHLDDGSGFTCRFWWFGYAHYCPTAGLMAHKQTSALGPLALSDAMDRERFASCLRPGRRGVKAVLTDQKRVSGIGNVYIQDTLFRARLHPSRSVADLDDKGVGRLYQAVVATLRAGYDKNGQAFELDFYGQPGGFTRDDFLVGYREGKPCPECGATVVKIRTGSTASYVCPRCQPE